MTVVVASVGQKVEPVVVNSDKSVTITASFPNVGEVIIKGSLLPMTRKFRTPAGVFGKKGKVEMTNTGSGLWSYTSLPLEPEIYTYNFEIEDKDTFDVGNPLRVRDGSTMLNYFIIRGGIVEDYVYHDNVPRGKVNLVWYKSSVEGLPRRRMAVYTPYGYSAARKYPVLYLLHGTGGDERSWLECGRAAQILDNLIFSRRCEPMIVVMTNEIADRAATPGEDPYNNKPAEGAAVESMLGITERAFVPDVVSYVDNHYSTLADKDHRAIAGLSLGGLHAIFITANRPDCFGYIGLFSAQTTNQLGNTKRIGQLERLANSAHQLKQLIPSLGLGKVGRLLGNINQGHLDMYDSIDVKLKRQFQNPPRLYYIACGKDDFVKKLNDDFRNKLDVAHLPYYYNETDGGHTWANWRKYLVDFLPRLFRKKVKEQ